MAKGNSGSQGQQLQGNNNPGIDVLDSNPGESNDNINLGGFDGIENPPSPNGNENNNEPPVIPPKEPEAPKQPEKPKEPVSLPSPPKETYESKHYDSTGIGSVMAPPKSSLADKGYKVFRLANTKRKGKVQIDGQDEVINPKTGKLEGIRLLRGVATIWMAEQDKISEGYVLKNKRNLVFEDRTMRVPTYDTQMLEFISMCRHYIDNPNRRTGSKHEFFEWNPLKQEQERLKTQQLEIDAILKANNVAEDKMRKHALYLGVDFADELGEPKTPAGIRSSYLLKAKANPKHFLDTLDSEIVDINFAVRHAIRDSRIDLGRMAHHAHWSNGGGLISRIPMNRNAADFLIEFAQINTDEGRDFKQRVLMLANK